MAQSSEEILKLLEARPAEWERIPDIPLYMDQVLSYMSRQLFGAENGDTLTSAMVNNYIKAGILPRAEEKRYGKEHIALLTAICILKRVMTAREISVLLPEHETEAVSVESFYGRLRESLDRNMNEALSDFTENMDSDELRTLALELAVNAYCKQLVCRHILSVLQGDAPTDKSKRHKAD